MKRLALAAIVLAAGCDSSPSLVPSNDTARALSIADEYKSWGRVDDELRWAPFLCRLPMPGIAHQSASKDSATHGNKLYSVFVKNHADYPADSKAGQVVVKESFAAEPTTEAFMPERPMFSSNITADHFYPYAKKDGVVYRAGAAAGLYIMYRVDPSVANTDDGWIYATVTPDRKVTASGRIASCMGCHEDAPHGRLFGVPTSPENF
jgi:hypothetical protein